MSYIYPSIRPAPSDKVSVAERDVLDALSVLDEGWHVLHSLWLKTHDRKLHAEADFVVITDRAVIILEVKGGEVWRDSNGWHFRTKSRSREDVKAEGPFDQARGAYYAFRNHLTDCGHPELFDDLVWGYGVICPECVLHAPENDSMVDPCMLLDERDFPAGLGTFLNVLAEYWSARYQRGDIPGIKVKRKKSDSISPARRHELLRYLRPDFELVAGIGAESVHVEKELLRLTDSQLNALDFMMLEERNILVGAAGTGKTVLLVEQARRKVSEGKRVLVLCFNKLLAKMIAASVQGDVGHRLDVGSYHQFALRLCTKAGISVPFSDSWGDFCISLKERSADMVSALTPADLYDYVLIDEGQDLMNDEFMDLVDCVLKGGLSKGSWMISCDIKQAIFIDNFNDELLQRLGSLSKKTALSLNCRNTRQIAAYVSGFSGEGATKTRGADGELPVFRYFTAREDYLRILKKIVNELVQSFVEAGLPISDIVLLFADKEFVPEESMKPGFFLRAVRQFEPLSGVVDCIQISSIQAYKGLEARAVVLLGISEFATGKSRGLFYVGASRAKTNLRVMLPVDCTHAKGVMPAISDILNHAA